MRNQCTYLFLETDNWTLLNWLWKYINEKTDYRAIAKEYLNVGESMISKLVIGTFDSEENAREYLNLVCAYYGKELQNVKVHLVIEEW